MADRGAVCWESRLYGSVRGWSATLVRMKYCGTGGKPTGKQRKQTSSYSRGSLQPTRKMIMLFVKYSNKLKSPFVEVATRSDSPVMRET